MKQYVAAIMVALLFMPSAALAKTATVSVPSGTPIEARVIEDIDPASINVGDIIFLAVDKNVVIKGRTVIRKDARILAEVREARKNTYLGQPDRIALAFRTVTAVDEQEIAVSGTTRSEGDDKTIAAVGLGIFCCPLFFLMKGKETVINAGRKIILHTIQKAEIRVR
jgi:hypothetical protein